MSDGITPPPRVRPGRADRDPGGDGALLPGVRHVRHHGPGPARRPRRPQARPPPHPLRHARGGRPPRPHPRQVLPRRRRRDRQVPPPRRPEAIYDALARMAQDFSLRHPLVDGHGNFGSPHDPPGAMRYTECRLAPLAMQLLAGIDEDTVDMVSNYDGKEEEPWVLPARFPNLLVNGSQGIAVGMATNIPPHNLGEVIDATVHLIDHPEATPDELMAVRQGPRLPHRRPHPGPGRHPGRLPHRPRLHQDAGRLRPSRTAPAAPRSSPPRSPTRRRSSRSRRRRPTWSTPAPSRASARSATSGPTGSDPAGVRAQARRGGPGRAQQPLQAHPAAVELRREHGGPGRRRAPHPQPGPDAHRLRRPPGRGRHPPHQVPPAQGHRPGPHRRRPHPGPRHDRPDHRPHPGLGRQGRRPRGADGGAVLLQRGPGRAHPRHDPVPPHPPGPVRPRGGDGQAAGDHRRAGGHPGRPRPPAAGHQGRAGRGPGQARRAPPGPDHLRPGRPRHPRPHRGRGPRRHHVARPATSRRWRPTPSAPRAAAAGAWPGPSCATTTTSSARSTPPPTPSCCSSAAGARSTGSRPTRSR